MTVGRSISKAELDSAVANVAGSVFATMDNAMKIKSFLDGFTSAQLASAGYVSTQGDGDLLKSAWVDLANMNAQWTGQATSGTMPRDHRTFVKQLLGIGLY